VNVARARMEATPAALLAAVAIALGPRGSRRLGRALGAAWHRLDPPHRRVARENLRRALPEVPEDRRRAIARESFRHFGAVAVDLLRFPAYRAADLPRLAEIAGWEHLEAAHRDGRGALVVSGHFGHWELVALIQGFRGRPMDMITRPLDNPRLEARLARARTVSGNRVVHKRSAVRGMLRALREGRSVAIVIDQNYREANRVFVDFFGTAAATTPALGVIAVRTGAPIVPVFSWPLPDGRYRIEYLAPLRPDPGADGAEEASRLTAACTRLIEEQIRRRPEVWLWMHRRWRTRPTQEPAAGAVAMAGGRP
jgi:KDO2-lipid IV(A) lauroyltransferase